MAGSPTGIGNPGRVTTPTPGPARKHTPDAALKTAWAKISAPWVTSGSSPASLITAASAPVAVNRQYSNRNCTRCPRGSVISI